MKRTSNRIHRKCSAAFLAPQVKRSSLAGHSRRKKEIWLKCQHPQTGETCLRFKLGSGQLAALEAMAADLETSPEGAVPVAFYDLEPGDPQSAQRIKEAAAVNDAKARVIVEAAGTAWMDECVTQIHEASGRPSLSHQILGPALYARARDLSAAAGMTTADLVLATLWFDLGKDPEFRDTFRAIFLRKAKNIVRLATRARGIGERAKGQGRAS